MKWIIYLLSLTEPKSYILVITDDSITYYNKRYITDKIIQVKGDVYIFKGGYAQVKTQYAYIEFFKERRTKYKIKNEVNLIE